MLIVDWKEGTTRGFKASFEVEDQQEVMFRVLGIKKEDNNFGWSGRVVQTRKLHKKGDVKSAFYVELDSNTKVMGQKLVNRYWAGSITVTVGFAPKVGDGVPESLKDKEVADYPVVIKTWGAFKMSQDDMFVLSLAIKESTSILVQLHQDEKNIPKIKKIMEDELAGG